MKISDVDAPFVVAVLAGRVRRPSSGSVRVAVGDPIRPDEVAAGEIERLAVAGALGLIARDPRKGLEYRAAGPTGALAEQWKRLQSLRDDREVREAVAGARARPHGQIADLLRDVPEHLKERAAAEIRTVRTEIRQAAEERDLRNRREIDAYIAYAPTIAAVREREELRRAGL